MKRATVKWIFCGGAVTGGVASILGLTITERMRQERVSSIFVEYEEGVNKTRCREILRFGAPESFPRVKCYKNHTLSYDQAKKIPLWVAEHLTAESLKGDAERKKSKFKRDPEVKEMFSGDNADYWKSGWSRGHMAPAGDNKSSQAAMNETFYLTNILPQNLENNAGFWNRFEIYCRDLTKVYDNVYVVSGPVMLAEVKEDGKAFVTYQVIGENQIAVPTHLYKVVVTEKQSQLYLGAFIVPNEPISNEKELKQYQVPLEHLECKVGLTFLPKLDRAITKDLCVEDGCKLISARELELYFIRRKMESSNTMHRLDTVWAEIEKKGLQPDEQMQNLYKRKAAEIAKRFAEKG